MLPKRKEGSPGHKKFACRNCQLHVGELASNRIQQLRGLLSIVLAALRGLIMQCLYCHKATAKLGYVATSIFAGIMQEGFCTAEETEDGDGGQNSGVFKEHEGTVSTATSNV